MEGTSQSSSRGAKSGSAAPKGTQQRALEPLASPRTSRGSAAPLTPRPGVVVGVLSSPSALPALLLALAVVSSPLLLHALSLLVPMPAVLRYHPSTVLPAACTWGRGGMPLGGSGTGSLGASFSFSLTKGSNPGGLIPGLPVLYFVAGVDGAGHEFFSTLFSLLGNQNVTVAPVDSGMHLIAAVEQVTDASKAGMKKWKGCPKLPYARQVYDFGAEVTSRLAALQDAPGVPFRGLYVRSRDTFPMGPMLTPLARPDLISLGLFNGIMYSLKVLFLVRPLSDVVWAGIRNETNPHDVGLLFRLAEDSLTYLDASVRELPCGSFAAVNLGRLLPSAGEPADPADEAALANGLASFLEIEGVGPEEMRRLLAQARSLSVKPGAGSAPKGPEAEEAAKWLEQSADNSPIRAQLWPLSAALASVPFHMPARPDDWPKP